MSRVDISVVVVSYNVRPFLDHCLQSIQRAANGLSVQIIVVDNASADDSADLVKTRYPDVGLIENSENVGFARANNQAFKRADGDAVLILNPDSFVQEDTLKILWDSLRSLDDVGAVGPKIIMPDGRFEPRSMRGFPTPWVAFAYLSGLSSLFPKNRFFSRYLLTYLDPDEQHDVDALSGCCMMVRRSLLDALQGFDEDYFMYGEDLDLCYRIRRQGHRILYQPATRIVHFKGESTRRSTIDHRYHFRKAMRLFVDKNLAGNVSQLSKGLLTLGFWVQGMGRLLIPLLHRLYTPLVDVLLLNLLILTGRLLRFGAPTYSPEVWLINSIYTLFYLGAGFYFGAYGSKRFSGRLSLYSSLTGAVLAAAFTYFFKQWAFSRFVVLWFSVWMILTMPGWRILFKRWVQKKASDVSRRFIRRRALIVGADDLGRRIAVQLTSNGTSQIDPVGFVDFREENIGQVIAGIPVLGNADELDRIIDMEGVEELVFSTSEVSYDHIIGLIQSLKNRKLEFKIIPSQQLDPAAEITLLHMEIDTLNQRRSRSGGSKESPPSE
jgi:GT2 family glycosyltransferase